MNITYIIGLFLISLLVGLAAWFFFLWAIKDKQFEDPEDVANRLNELDDVNQVPRTGRGAET
jgi:cbb3-type cytochrome oxidase maturation protein